MAIQDDFSVAVNGDIRYTGTTTNYTVIQFHRWLQDLADNAAATGDDILDITDQTPSDRSTDNIITLINGFNIDQTASEHLYDGSIIQGGGTDVWDGIVNFGNAEFIDIMQNGALYTNDFWNVNYPAGFNADVNGGISHRFMIKTRTAGVDVDGRRLLGITHEYNKTYGEFNINGTANGNNVLALSQQTDLNNATAAGTVATWDQFVNTEGYQQLNITGAGANPFYSQWTVNNGGTVPASPDINDLYEYTKWVVRRGSAETIYGLDQAVAVFRGITHEIDIDTPTGTFVEPEQVSWGTGATAGIGQLIAIDSVTAGTKMWIQLLSGVAPTDGLVITGVSTATATVNVTVLARTPVPIPFVGASTGSALIGGYGVGVDPTDLTASDLLTDLGAVTRQPPNNVTFTVAGLVIGEDRVLVTRNSGGLPDKTQYTLSGTLNAASVTAVVVTPAIETDTPQVGVLRVVNDSGYDVFLPYTSWTGSTFTITAYNFNGVDEFDSATSGNGAYVGYIDKLATATSESFTVVFNTVRSLFVRVRDGGTAGDTEGIKTFQTTGSLTSAGGSTTAIRTPDA
jgi:hypothetical protein